MKNFINQIWYDPEDEVFRKIVAEYILNVDLHLHWSAEVHQGPGREPKCIEMKNSMVWLSFK